MTNRTEPDDWQNVILLGASNLTLGWVPLLKSLQTTVPGPLDVRASLGMGRSYVDWSGFWLRRLPGIIDCGLWKNLPTSGSKPPLILVTDVGNDIVYQHSPERILKATTECIQRLRDWRPDAKIVMTGLPIDSVKSVGPVRFVIARSVLFPGCRMPFSEILARSESLEQSAQQFAQQNNIPYLIPQAEWYRTDPIHVIKPLRESVFQQFFSHWNVHKPVSDANQKLPRASLPVSALRTVCGFQRTAQQPAFDSKELRVSAW